MRAISWLHISDVHMRPQDKWAQDIVMRAMCNDIDAERKNGVVDFILVTGDLAYSGKAHEYALVASFLDGLSEASGVPKERIFCVPGNHDIDRDRQAFCFRGARAALQDQNITDAFLGSLASEDFQTLLQREESYREFQRDYFSEQSRAPTDDGLAYVARLAIDGVRIAILGLDSAWLAHGGSEDHTKLLIGERQVINATTLAQDSENPPHILVAMGHHPLHLLQDFDRRPIQDRIENGCHFYHCGHLHEPEERPMGFRPSGCLTLAAGACFDSRQSHNAYSVITLDLLAAERCVRTLQFNPRTRAFGSVSTQRYHIEVNPVETCSVLELAESLHEHGEISWTNYFAALILDKKAEVPVHSSTGHTLGSFAVLKSQPEGELRTKTIAFFTFRNALRVLHGRKNLAEILYRHGDVVAEYSAVLEALCESDPGLRTRLDQQEEDAGVMAPVEPTSTFEHTFKLFAELAEADEWNLLREQASRHLQSTDSSLAVQAKRSVALALAHSEDPHHLREAVTTFKSVLAKENAQPTDAVNLATLLFNIGDMNGAKAAVLSGVERWPEASTQLAHIGQRIVEATGDRTLRNQLTEGFEKAEEGGE